MYLFKNIAEVQTITDKWITKYSRETPYKRLF